MFKTLSISTAVCVLMLLVAFTASTASATIIIDVDRTRGTAGDRVPIGTFDTDTDPLATEVGNLKDGNIVFSDRTYGWTATPGSMIGQEHVRTFNTDKANNCIMVNYAVTIGEAAVLWITMDDRLPLNYTTAGGVQVFLTQQEAVDLVVRSWAAAGTFVDTGVDLTIDEGGGRPMSVYATQSPLEPGTYNFGLNPTGSLNFYTIGAVPEPATIALLALGGLAVLRRKRVG